MDAEAARLAGRLGDGVHPVRVGAGRAAILKCRRDAPDDFFAAEDDGLAALAASGALRVPLVLARARDWMLLEDLGRGRSSAAFWAAAGAGLAGVHAQPAAHFGWHRDGYCGTAPQANAQRADGHAFFAECRLRPQLARALHAGRLTREQAARGGRIAERLYVLLPAAPPVLVHGDLWLGNLHCCADGTPALIDGGAVHQGWAEADLAMLTLFGEPPAGFFDAYRERGNLARGWRERAPLYNLYHLLNHLNLFGAGYHGQVLAVLRRFGG